MTRTTTTLQEHAAAADESAQGRHGALRRRPTSSQLGKTMSRQLGKAASSMNHAASTLPHLNLGAEQRVGVEGTPERSGSPVRQRPAPVDTPGTDSRPSDRSDSPVPGEPARPGAEVPPSKLTVAWHTTYAKVFGVFHTFANKDHKIWRKEFKRTRNLLSRIPVRYMLRRFIRDGVAVLCVTTALYDTSIFALPYMVLPAVYVQLWIGDGSVVAKRRADKVRFSD